MGDPRHALHVDMDAILEGLGRDGRDPFIPYLDLKTGEVCFSQEWDETAAAGGSAELESEDERLIRLHPTRFAQVPRIEAHEEVRLMRSFAAGQPEQAAAVLLEALDGGPGVVGRFHDALQATPDGAARWERARHDAHLGEALSWLRMLGVEPTWQLRHQPPHVAPPPVAQEAHLHLMHLLVLGTPVPAPDGVVARAVVMEGKAARGVFRRLCRQLCELKGLAWRARFVEGKDVFEVEDVTVALEPGRVTVKVRVPLAVAALFAAPRPPDP